MRDGTVAVDDDGGGALAGSLAEFSRGGYASTGVACRVLASCVPVIADATDERMHRAYCRRPLRHNVLPNQPSIHPSSQAKAKPRYSQLLLLHSKPTTPANTQCNNTPYPTPTHCLITRHNN